MLRNLVSNSIDAAGPEARIKVIRRRDSLEVSDMGPGMSAEQASKAADAFYTTRAEQGGTGLGLYLVKRFAAGLGWKMRIESEPFIRYLSVSLSLQIISPDK